MAKLDQHPAPIIGYISLINAFFCYMSLSRYFICYGNAEVAFAATVYFDTSPEAQLKAFNTMSSSYLVLLVYFANATTILEVCLLYDMVFTLHNPMRNGSSRVKWYVLGTFAYQTITVITYASQDFQVDTTPAKIAFYTTKVLYLVMFLPALMLVMFHFRKAGLNQQYRKLHIRRYVLYCSLMVCC